jgi:hypothetical protein
MHDCISALVTFLFLPWSIPPTNFLLLNHQTLIHFFLTITFWNPKI